MSEASGGQIEALKKSIAALEAQRGTLGDTVVEAALIPLREKLSELELQQHAGQRAVEQQRKQVTVVFMDIAGSTQLVSGMDPEQAMDIFDSALKRLGSVVEAQGGRVTRYMGDGLLAVFGAPVAREDDPQRALRAGLGLVVEAKQVGEALGMADFTVRVGVNTGLVAVGGQTEAEDTLMGSAVNLAARLESAAPLGGVLISQETYRHVRGSFDIIESEPVIAKGFAQPIRSYRVLQAKVRSFHLPLRDVEGLETRMVGREGEIKHLQDAFMNTLESGEGQVITVSGEAGVGKSRMLEEFQNWLDLRPERIRFFQGRGRVEGQGQPFAVMREVFADRFEILEDDNPQTVREKFVCGLKQGWNEQGEMKAHLLGQMLGYDFTSSLHLKGVLGDGEQLRNRGMMYLGEYFMEISRQWPVVILLEDVHWADDSTLDMIRWLEERMDKLRMLVVCAGREALYERRPYWGEGEEYHLRVGLKLLTKRESRELVEDILRHVTHLPDTLRDLVVENAEGNPFYLEELIKMLIEDGVIVKGETEWTVEQQRLQGTTVPGTLTGVLQARLDGLPVEERKVLQEASVVGRQFWDRLVAYVDTNGKPEAYPGLLQERLSSLRGRELIFRRETSAFAEAHEYLFKHDVLREVTYESVLKKVRQAHHGLVADWLISNAGARLSEYAGLIAQHLQQAGRMEQAVSYFLQAGQSALTTFANAEAEGYFRQALELSPEDLYKAACLAGLGDALSRHGSRQEAVNIFRQSIELYMKIEDSDNIANLYSRLAAVLWYKNYQEAWDACQEGLKRLEGVPESRGMARLLAEAGRTAHFLARPTDEVISLCQQAIAMAERLSEQVARASASITIASREPDFKKSINLLQEAVDFSVASMLWDQAHRAHACLGSTYVLNDESLEIGYQHFMQAVDISIHIGNIEMLFFDLHNLAFNLEMRGYLYNMEDKLRDILHRSIAPQSRVNEFLEGVRSDLLSPRGEWTQALEYYQQYQGELRKTSRYQEITNTNFMLTDVNLELNRFMGIADLSKAEAAMRENIEIDWNAIASRLMLVVILIRQMRIAEARERLAEVIQDLKQLNSIESAKSYESNIFSAEAELARAEGCWEEAESKVQALIDIFRAGGYRWNLARQLIDLGDVLISRDLLGDRDQARQVYQEALELFTEMGANGYVQVLQKRLESLQGEHD